MVHKILIKAKVVKYNSKDLSPNLESVVQEFSIHLIVSLIRDLALNKRKGEYRAKDRF
ncbi:protein of unknown function [Legionella hackeliae]|uniref:Uncharacterized protein n=1 Tax=Legionella hackeliae TaxID=449 RepID=A0A0A8UVH9_LEGHA|nr:protein of unknown function [Legionella hackeliae]